MGGFWNSSSFILNGYSIFRLCLTFWTNEFLGSYCNYKFIISFSMFNRMDLWRILCSQSNIEEFFSISFCITIYSSNNPLRLNTNNKIPFFPFIFLKDYFSLFIVIFIYIFQCYFGVSSLSHPDNALEACAL